MLWTSTHWAQGRAIVKGCLTWVRCNGVIGAIWQAGQPPRSEDGHGSRRLKRQKNRERTRTSCCKRFKWAGYLGRTDWGDCISIASIYAARYSQIELHFFFS